MKTILFMLAIELFFLIKSFLSYNSTLDYEFFFGFFAFIGFAFLIMNIFNTTFPSIAANAGADKSSIRGLTKETLKSELEKDFHNKSFVLFSKTNLVYLSFFMLNFIVLLVITIIKY